MGWRIRKSVKIGKGIRVNLSKSGIGLSAGVPGLRVSMGPDGKVRRTIGIPGTGVYNTEVIEKAAPKSKSACPNCGGTVAAKANYCHNCGAKLK